MTTQKIEKPKKKTAHKDCYIESWCGTCETDVTDLICSASYNKAIDDYEKWLASALPEMVEIDLVELVAILDKYKTCKNKFLCDCLGDCDCALGEIYDLAYHIFHSKSKILKWREDDTP